MEEAPVTADEVTKEIQLKEDVDFVKAGRGVVYMSTKLSGLTKNGFTRLIGRKMYQEMTMRSFNTARKILTLMEK